jgi:hypothetical protein
VTEIRHGTPVLPNEAAGFFIKNPPGNATAPIRADPGVGSAKPTSQIRQIGHHRFSAAEFRPISIRPLLTTGLVSSNLRVRVGPASRAGGLL